MAAPTFEETVHGLVALAMTKTPVTSEPIDEIVAQYLAGVDGNALAHRLKLAEAFLERGGTSERSDLIHLRILGRIIP